MKKLTALVFTLFLFSTIFLFNLSSIFAQTPSFQEETQQETVDYDLVEAPVLVEEEEPVEEVLADETSPEGQWIRDADVTFVGKAGARSGEFLDWTMQRYNWSYVGEGQQNPIAAFWANIRNITYAFLILFILGTAFMLIITRGKNITIMRFIPRFIFIILLITFSFALIQFIYQVMDIIQGFFLTVPGASQTCSTNNVSSCVSQKNLLNIGFNYKDFQGFRIYGPEFDESVFISLLLVKLTALTYYVMSGILILRKIILWFFIIISPIFPLLLFYSPIRNTAKIWVGEFFRWLLYGPLFAIFLAGLVQIWRSDTNIPLKFAKNTEVIYPTAINILLGGPQQILSLTNSVNNKDTFALYIVALLMLWVVIILPFLLLQIFLDYINSLSEGEDNWLKQLTARGSSLMAKVNPSSPPPPQPLPVKPFGAGLAKKLPFGAKIEIPEIKADAASFMSQASNMRVNQANMHIANLSNLSIPTMADIAKYETSLMSRDLGRRQEVAKMHETLEKIANPKGIGSSTEREKYSSVKNQLVAEKLKGNNFASSVITASTIASGASPSKALGQAVENAKLTEVMNQLAKPDKIASAYDKQKATELKEELLKAKANGDVLATSILATVDKGDGEISEDLRQKLKEAKERGNSIANQILQQAGIAEFGETQATLPVVNRVQPVNIDDYESVKKIWTENYHNLEVPKVLEGKVRGRKEWIKEDMDKIDETINLLASSDNKNVNKGMEEVGTILPFLLIGGFSQTEVIAYLKAKLEAAKTVFAEIGKKEEEEETMVEAARRKHEEPKKMHTEAKAEIPKEKKTEEVKN